MICKACGTEPALFGYVFCSEGCQDDLIAQMEATGYLDDDTMDPFVALTPQLVEISQDDFDRAVRLLEDGA